MLSLDLFNSQFEKKLHEGAVDDAEYARLKMLGEKIDYLKQARRQTKDPAMQKAIDNRIEQYHNERVEILSVRGMKEAQQPQQQQTPAKGQDLITPQQRVAGATPPKTSMMGKAKETFSSFANWLAGRDDTGPTYETRINENDPSSAINSAKYAYEQMRRAHDENVDIASIRWIAGGDPVTMSRNQLYHTLMKLKTMSRQNRNAFALQTLADRNNFYLWLGSQKKITPRPQLKQPVDPMQPELPLGKPKMGPVQERDQKKKSSDTDDIKAGDVKVARELQKLRAQYPAARSDIEAVARAEIDGTERSNQQLAAIRGANEKQDALLKQLVDLDRQQGREIDALDQENNSLEKQLAQVQSTNNRLQQAIGRMTGTKQSTRPQATSKIDTVATPDADTLKKVQDLESQIQQLKSQPNTGENQKQISDLGTRLSALQAQVGQRSPGQTVRAPSPFSDLDIKEPGAKKTSLRPQAPASDLDIKPKKTAKPKTTKAKSKTSKTTAPDDDIDLLNIEEPDLFAVQEHGGGIGPKQHWQDLMPEGQAQETIRKYLSIDAENDVEAVRSAIQAISRDPALGATSKERLLGQVGMIIRRHRLPIGRSYYTYMQRYMESQKEPTEQELVEGIKDTASATAVIACLLTGGSLSGCASAPQKTTAQQVLKTGQDIGRTVQTAQRITRAGAEEEVKQELRNLLRGISGRPEELNHSNILRIWRKIKGAPPVQPEPQAPEYGPAEPVKRTPQYEAKEIHTRDDFVRERDRLLRMITQETNPANKQILRSAIRQLENRAENEGWIAVQQRMIRESNASGAAEQAILKRIMVSHTDLLKQYGPQKVTQAAEEVAYNVGDLDEIGSSDVSGWVMQVKQILGATA
jgi:hypothetical protein